MADFITPYLFNAHALPVNTKDSHAQPGNHLRVDHHPLLGLPVAPFIVERGMVDTLKRLNIRTEVIYKDSFKNELTPPFSVNPGNPVTAYIPAKAGEVCLWAEVIAAPSKGVAKPGSGRQTPGPFRFKPPLQGLPDVYSRWRIGDPIFKPILETLECEAFISSGSGPATIGRRSEPRYGFSGPGITEIRITGKGLVSGLNWIEAGDNQKIDYQPYALMNLPHSGGKRYLSLPNALALANARVETQAPKRRPLQETLNTPAPHAAPVANALFEKDRVNSLADSVLSDLEPLINDLGQPQHSQLVSQPITDAQGTEIGVSSIPRLSRVLQMLADPGTASLLGYKLYDPTFQETEGRLVFYRIHGFFNNAAAREKNEELLLHFLIQALPEGTTNQTPAQIGRHFHSLIGDRHYQEKYLGTRIDESAWKDLQDHRDYFSMTTVAIADCGAPLDAVAAPQLPAPQEQPPLSDDWIPALPPIALREVQIAIAGARVGGLLAAGKHTPAGVRNGRYQNLNKENQKGFHLPLALGFNSSDGKMEPASEPGTGFIADRTASPERIAYSVAQQDRFGRWSPWAARTHRSGIRPRPPIPEFLAYYTQPAIAEAASSGGQILVQIMVPDPATLAPGSYLLNRLRLLRKDSVSGQLSELEINEAEKTIHPADTNRSSSDPSPRYLLNLTWTGPVLSPTEQRELRLVAHWIDTQNQLSDASRPQTLKLVDPRPPAQLSVPDTLQYAARPDVNGLCWVEYRWNPQQGQKHFGIYYTDENRLRSHLAKIGRDDVLARLDTIENNNAAARATVFRDNAELFTDHLFERLNDVEVSYNSSDRPKGFRHGVSGSLRVLNFYKITAESKSGARPVLKHLPLLVFGIPNSDPPQRPTIKVSPVTSGTALAASVEISLLVGATRAVKWRLRRSSLSTSTLAKVPIVNTGDMSDLNEQTGRQKADYVDRGPVQIAPSATLRPWVRYSWVAEVQGAPESGSQPPVPGRWSRPSDPFSLVLIPEQPPTEPNIEDITVSPDDGVTIRINHPDELNGGAVGPFRLRLTRRLADDTPMELVRDEAVSGKGPFLMTDSESAAEPVPQGTKYFAEVIDPLGRTSARAYKEVT